MFIIESYDLNMASTTCDQDLQ